MDLKGEISETVRYIIIGIILAVAINFILGAVLGVNKPVMAVVSNSMEPTLNKGDLVIIKGVNPDDIKIGDIIVYYNRFKHIPVVHRVVGIEEIDGERYFITKGDNDLTNPLPDQDPRAALAPPVSREDIRGKVIFTIPKVGLVKVYFSEAVQKLGIVKAGILLFVAFLIFGMVEDYIKELRKKTSRS